MAVSEYAWDKWKRQYLPQTSGSGKCLVNSEKKKKKKNILVKENPLHLFSLCIVPVAQITKLLPVLTDVCVVFYF